MRNETLEIREERVEVAWILFLFSIFYFLFSISLVSAAPLSQVRDLIGTSQPNATTSHTIQFTATNPIPASGSFTVSFPVGEFTIPVGFTLTDIDLAVATSSGYVDRTLASSANATNDGVTVTTGTSGSVRIALNSTEGIPAGGRVRVILGPLASVGGSGSTPITNSGTPGSYRITISTADASSILIDKGDTIVVMVLPVTMTTRPPDTPPVRFNGLPSGTVAANSNNIEVSLSTNTTATCRYATSTGVTYGSMTNEFPQTFTTNFYQNLTGFLNSQTYEYYVRCRSGSGIENTDDYLISFTLAPTPVSTVSNGIGGADGRGGVGEFRNGSPVLYRSSVILSGHTAPLSSVTVVQDGVALAPVTARADGTFTREITNLERGTYTFFTYSEDSQRRKTHSYPSTLTLTQNSVNTISGIVLPPSIAVSSDRVNPGEPLRLFGEAIPGAFIEIMFERQAAERTGGDIKRAIATSTLTVPGIPNGVWSLNANTTGWKEGTYFVTARARVGTSTESSSLYSRPVSLGIGQDAEEPLGGDSVDLSSDGKVNLVDFSIFLSLLGGSGRGDFNNDGTVNIGDLSIMLFAWTG